MGAEFERLGYEAGKKVANDCKREIRKSHPDDLPELAGIKMHLTIREAKNAIYNMESWQMGFWSGFMDKAEELRS